MAALSEFGPREPGDIEDEEEADDESGFTLQEVLRLGGTKVREKP